MMSEALHGSAGGFWRTALSLATGIDRKLSFSYRRDRTFVKHLVCSLTSRIHIFSAVAVPTSPTAWGPADMARL